MPNPVNAMTVFCDYLILKTIIKDKNVIIKKGRLCIITSSFSKMTVKLGKRWSERGSYIRYILTLLIYQDDISRNVLPMYFFEI